MKIKYRALTDNTLKNNMGHLKSTVGVMTAFSLVALYLIWNSKGESSALFPKQILKNVISAKIPDKIKRLTQSMCHEGGRDWTTIKNCKTIRFIISAVCYLIMIYELIYTSFTHITQL